MRALKAILAISIFSLNILAGDGTPSSNGRQKKYCARLKGGELKIVYEGKEINSDVYLADGTKIKTNGAVIRQNGTQISLKEGECIDSDGKIINEKTIADKEEVK